MLTVVNIYGMETVMRIVVEYFGVRWMEMHEPRVVSNPSTWRVRKVYD